MNDYQLKSVISLYQNDNLDSYMEISDVVTHHNKTHLANTRPLSPRTLSEFARLSVNKELSTKHILSRDIVYLSFKDRLEIIAYRERCMRMFEMKDVCKKVIKYPDLVFHLKGNTLRVYSCKMYAGELTQLFYVPFPNNIGDHICMGSISIKNDDYVELIHEYIEAYYSSVFTSEGLPQIKSNLNPISLYKSLDGRKSLNRYLKPIMNGKKQLTLKDLIK